MNNAGAIGTEKHDAGGAQRRDMHIQLSNRFQWALKSMCGAMSCSGWVTPSILRLREASAERSNFKLLRPRACGGSGCSRGLSLSRWVLRGPNSGSEAFKS